MLARWETVQVAGQPMRVYLAVPARPGPLPGVVIAQHAGGVDGPIQDTVHRLAREGYVAAAAELFHRQPAGPMNRLERAAMVRDDELIADMNATIDHMKSLDVEIGPIGVFRNVVWSGMFWIVGASFTALTVMDTVAVLVTIVPDWDTAW